MILGVVAYVPIGIAFAGLMHYRCEQVVSGTGWPFATVCGVLWPGIAVITAFKAAWEWGHG